jgi:hypothetical protein
MIVSAVFVQTKGLWLGVAVGDPFLDCSFEFFDAPEDAAADALARDFGEQPLDEVDPRRGGRREMQLEARMFAKPCLHLGGLVSTVIVANQVQVEVLGDRPVDLLKEADKLIGTMSR